MVNSAKDSTRYKVINLYAQKLVIVPNFKPLSLRKT